MMAPVEGSGTWPAWMQTVLNLAVSRSFTWTRVLQGRLKPAPTYGLKPAPAYGLKAAATYTVRVGFLWRVRRKLTLSYVFIGFVPILLIVVFFLLCGLLLFFNVSSYLVQSRVSALVDETRFLAEATTIELAQAADDPTFDEVLTRRQEAASARYHGASIVVVPTMRTSRPANATPGRSGTRRLF